MVELELFCIMLFHVGEIDDQAWYDRRDIIHNLVLKLAGYVLLAVFVAPGDVQVPVRCVLSQKAIIVGIVHDFAPASFFIGCLTRRYFRVGGFFGAGF